MLMMEDMSFEPSSIEPGEVSQLDPNTKINVFQTTGRGNAGPKVMARVTPEAGKSLSQTVHKDAIKAQKENPGTQVTGIVIARDAEKSGEPLENIQKAGVSGDGNPDTSPSTSESRFMKGDIMEMRRKYLSENAKVYAKKNFYNRGSR